MLSLHYFKVYLYHQPVYQDTIYSGSETVINENVCKPIYLNDLQNNLKFFFEPIFLSLNLLTMCYINGMY